MKPIPLYRRVLVAAVGITCAAFLTRSQLADALVLRGDECLYRAQPGAGLSYYRRALWLDGSDGAAVDRFAFVAMTLRDPHALKDSVAIASAYLRRAPNDDVVRLDRAMAYRALGKHASALADFATAGGRARDPRALTFAGYEAKALGHLRLARALWSRALALEPNFLPARHALVRSEHRR